VARTLLLGLLATVLAVTMWLVTSSLGLGGSNGILAIGAGLVLGLTRDKTPLARYGAFLIGLIFGILALVAGAAGWIGFVIAILLLTLISGLTGGRLPLWAMILGAGTFSAMYLPSFTQSAWYVLTEYPTTFFLAVAASSGTFIVAVLVELIIEHEEDVELGKVDGLETAQAADVPAPAVIGSADDNSSSAGPA
jgi:hypothetical protein